MQPDASGPALFAINKRESYIPEYLPKVYTSYTGFTV